MQGHSEPLKNQEEVGFLKDFSCIDLVHVFGMVRERSIEWGEVVWMASLDLEKAVDKILHEAVLEGLRTSGVDAQTIVATRNLYSDQVAHVQLDTQLRSMATMRVLRI